MTLGDQLDAARDDPLRVLVVGAGVAGASVTRLLRNQGLHPVLLERSDSGVDEGYMLGLMPLVDEPLRQLGAWPEYCERSVAMHRYQLRSSRGQLVRTYSLDAALAEFGRYGGIERGELMEVLASQGSPVMFGATVTSLTQTAAGVSATMHNSEGDCDAQFDLVIAADGMHSATRGLVLRADEVQTYDTGWGGWVAWVEADPADNDLYVETWGRGFFIGRYPVRDRVGVFVGGPRTSTVAGAGPFVSRIRDLLRHADPMTAQALTAIDEAHDPYHWSFTDTRASRWAVGRVVLLGDAAAGFLPTAGIGAAMAMESAAVLATQLKGVQASEVARALGEYERQQRPRVIAAHDNSRQLAKLMFRQGRVICTLRDIAMRAATLKMALGPIIKLHQNAPLHTAATQEA